MGLYGHSLQVKSLSIELLLFLDRYYPLLFRRHSPRTKGRSILDYRKEITFDKTIVQLDERNPNLKNRGELGRICIHIISWCIDARL